MGLMVIGLRTKDTQGGNIVAAVVSILFSVGYYLVCSSVVIRGMLMLAAYCRSSADGRKKAGTSLALSAAAEIAWCVLVGLSFHVSRTDFIPLVLSAMGLSVLRRISPFEKVGSQHVYSLLASLFPSRQAALARAAAQHLF